MGRRPVDRALLVTAYACAPDAGSEIGAGWGMLLGLAEHVPCVVLTQPDHGPAIRAWLEAHPKAPITVHEVSEGATARRLGNPRVSKFLRYLAWVPRARRTARRLVKNSDTEFGAAWHVTYSSFWAPTPLRGFDIPVVLGPLGGAVGTHPSIRPRTTIGARSAEALEDLAVAVGSRLPSTRRGLRHAAIVLAQNPETSEALVKLGVTAPIVLNHAVFAPVERICDGLDPADLIWCASLTDRKGPTIAVEALARTPAHVHLTMIGAGRRARQVASLARKLGVEDRLTMTGSLSREQVAAHLRDARGAVLTGWREEGGLFLGEALASGTPLAVLGHGGAAVVAAEATRRAAVRVIEPRDYESMVDDFADAMTDMSAGSVHRNGPLIDRGANAGRLVELLELVGFRF